MSATRPGCSNRTRSISTICCSKPCGCWRNDAPTRERINRRYEFLMVDEYQDTNRSQYDLMRLLTGDRHNVAVVGDEDQSIYGWRGANIRNILDFERDFPGAITIRLEQNYRSTKNILEAASAVVANNTERIGKWLWTESGEGDKITLYEAPDAENEALWIADKIEAHMARNPEEHVAVLYRTNAQSRQIEEALRRYGRKYIVVGGFSFYQRAEVKDVIAYLRVLLSPQDTISLLRIINTPARGIGRTTIEQIEQYALTHELGSVDRARADARGTRLPCPRGSGAFGVPQHDEGTRGRDRNAAAGGNPERPARPHRLSQDARRGRHRGSAPRAWPTWTNSSTRRPMRRNAASRCATSWTTPRWFPTPTRWTIALRSRC